MSATEPAEVRLFHNHREAEFLRRENRFRVSVRDGGREFSCHLPNPGRLTEILLPGIRLILEERRRGEGYAPAKTAWTVVGAYHKGVVVPLYSAGNTLRGDPGSISIFGTPRMGSTSWR